MVELSGLRGVSNVFGSSVVRDTLVIGEVPFPILEVVSLTSEITMRTLIAERLMGLVGYIYEGRQTAFVHLVQLKIL